MARTRVQQSQISGSLSVDISDGLTVGEGLAAQTSLVGDLNALRTQINKIIGQSHWYDALTGSQDLSDIFGAMHVTGADADFMGNITAVGDVSAVSGSFSGDLTVTGDVSAQDAVFGGDISAVNATLTGDLSAVNATLSGDLSAVSGSFSGDLSVTGDISAQDATLSGDLSAVNGTFSADLSAVNATLSGDLSAVSGSFSGDLSVTGDVSAEDATLSGDLSAVNGTFSADLSAVNATLSGDLSAVSGSFSGDLAVTGDVSAEDATLSGDLSAANITASGMIKANNALDPATYLYVVGINGEISASNFVTADAGVLSVAGAISASAGIDITGGGLSVAGDTLQLTTGTKLQIDDLVQDQLLFPNASHVVTQSADLSFSSGVLNVGVTFTADAATGNMTAHSGSFGGELSVTGNSLLASVDVGSGYGSTGVTIASNGDLSMDGDLVVEGTASFNGDVNLGATSGDLIDFKGEVKSDIVPSADETYDLGSSSNAWNKLYVNSGSFGFLAVSGDAVIDGDLRVKGNTTWIETENLVVKDSLIHISTGSADAASRGIVLHGSNTGTGEGDIAIGAKAAGYDFVFAKLVDDSDVDVGNSEIFADAQLAAAWMSGVKIGGAEGLASGSLSVNEPPDGAGITLSSTGLLNIGSNNNTHIIAQQDLLLQGNGADPLTFISGSGEYSSFMAQFPGMSIVGAIVAAGGNFKQDSFKPGAVGFGNPIDYSSVGTLRTASYGSLAAKKLAMDVYLNGVRLAYTDDYAIDGSGVLTLTMNTEVDDVLTVVIHNAL